MPRRPTPWFLLAALATATCCAGARAQLLTVDGPPQATAAGRLELDLKSEFSHIRLRRQGSVRSLIFVRDNGDEAFQSQVDLRRPQVLRYSYLRTLVAAYLFQPQQKQALIVGLGGGSLVHFFRAVDPELEIEAVEIDPVVVEIAAEHFGVQPSDKVRIVTADGLKHIVAAPPGKFDAIYMDAFLKPGVETDDTGAPLALRTREFYNQMKSKFAPHGVVAFNLNPHPQTDADVAAIADAFPQAYVFELPRNEGLVVVASTDARRLPAAEIARRARELDQSHRFQGLVNFRDMTKRLRQ